MTDDWMDEESAPWRSWVESANAPANGFPLQNLPYGVFRRAEAAEARIGVAVGAQVLDLFQAAGTELLRPLPPALCEACRQPDLNALMALGRPAWQTLRRHLLELLREGSAAEPACRTSEVLVARDQVTLLLPARIGDYTDFYASIEHATHVGSLFRPENPLLPNYRYVPVGYHGRASSIVVSGTGVRRPWGQALGLDGPPPEFAPTRRLDYELELGLLVGPGNPAGAPIPIAGAGQHMFGLCLVNDWSARDLQRWEYQPLGPFLAKNFATSISPWVVTMEALKPFRVPARPRASSDPAPLPYLHSADDQRAGGLDLILEVWLRTEGMTRAQLPEVRISRCNFRSMYWTLAQMLTHHASNGCPLRPGDLLGSGTVSGPEPEQGGCLLEQTLGGRNPIPLPGGELRRFLEDGDTVVLRGYAERQGWPRISLGECAGTVLPATMAG